MITSEEMYFKAKQSMRSSLESALIKRRNFIEKGDTKKANEYGRIIKDTMQILNDTEKYQKGELQIANELNPLIKINDNSEVVKFYLEWDNEKAWIYDLYSHEMVKLGLIKDEKFTTILKNVLLSNIDNNKVEVHFDEMAYGLHIKDTLENIINTDISLLNKVSIFGYKLNQASSRYINLIK